MGYTDRLTGTVSSVVAKPPVKAATTANITLSGAQAIDGVSIVAGDRVLVKDQADATENGIYVCADSAWPRAADFDATTEIAQGTFVVVTSGSSNGGLVFKISTSAPDIGVTSIDWSPTTFAASVSVSSFMTTPVQAGSTAAFLTALGVSSAVQSILDDADLEAVRDTLLISSKVVSKAADYALNFTDRGKIIDFTAAKTLTVFSAGTAGDGFYFGVKASGGDVALTRDVDGITTPTINKGNTVWVMSDGLNWKWLVPPQFRSGTWTAEIWDSGVNQGSIASQTSKYWRSGQMVTVSANLTDIDTTGLTAGQQARVKSLPFTPTSAEFFGTAWGSAISVTDVIVPWIQSSGEIYLLDGNNSLLVSDFTSGTADLILSITYYTDDP